jgi:hypothetical protein
MVFQHRYNTDKSVFGKKKLRSTNVTIQRIFKALLPSTLENREACLQTTGLKHDYI